MINLNPETAVPAENFGIVEPKPATPSKAAVVNPLLASYELKSNKEAEIEYKNGLRFRLRYIRRATLNKMFKDCTKMKWDANSKTRVPTLDNDAFLTRFCQAAVVKWEGATLKVLSGIAPLDVSKVSDEQLDQELPYSVENLVYLMKNAYDLDDFLQNAACSLEYFDSGRDEEVKNS